MRLRLLLCATLALAAGVPAATAAAAPRKVCKLLGAGSSDAPRDVVPDPAVRIISADIASNRTYLTAVIRVESIEDSFGPVAGRDFEFYFSRSREESYVIEGRLWGTTPQRFELSQVSVPFDGEDGTFSVKPFATATGVIDRKTNEVRITVPLSRFRAVGGTVRDGARVTYLGAQMTRVYGPNRPDVTSLLPIPNPVGNVTYNWSVVRGGTAVSYVLGTPSCVPVGR